MGNKSRRAYPPEFRQQMVELYHAGRSTTELAQDFLGQMRSRSGTGLRWQSEMRARVGRA